VNLFVNRLKSFQRMNRFLFTYFAVLLWLPLTGQQDRYAIHFDKPFYTTGEVIWFTVHPPLAGPEPLPGVLRVVLYDPDGAEIDHFHLRQSKTQFASGYIKIPYDWHSGKYRLTLHCSLFPEGAFSPLLNVLIPIYNDLEPSRLEAEDIHPDNDTLAFQASDEGMLQVSVELDRNSYKPGTYVEATLSVKDQKGRPIPANLSISVTDQALMGGSPAGEQTFQASALDKPACIHPQSPMAFQGQVLDSTGNPQRTFSLSAYLSARDTLLYTQTDVDGNFVLPLPDFYGEAVIQFTDFVIEGIQIKQRFPPQQVPTKELLYNKSIIDYLRYSRQRKKIYQLYGSLEMVIKTNLPTQSRRIRNPDRLIRLSDYEPFPDITSLFRELETPLKFRKKDGRQAARMFNRDRRQFYRGDPVFLVDGQLTTDAAYIANIDIDNIEEIGLYYDATKLNELFGLLGLGGVVIMKTGSEPLMMPSSVAPNRFSIAGLQPPASFAAVPKDRESEQPVFRPLIFWQGTLSTNSDGKAFLKFAHTDDRSTFQIKVVAQAPDGRIGFGTGKYWVEP
jgi:hypothetical protein